MPLLKRDVIRDVSTDLPFKAATRQFLALGWTVARSLAVPQQDDTTRASNRCAAERDDVPSPHGSFSVGAGLCEFLPKGVYVLMVACWLFSATDGK
jgi:hypothetical protein